MAINVLISMLLSVSLLADHAFYVSACHLYIQDNTYRGELRIFQDDLILGLERESITRSAVQHYLEQHFLIDGRPVGLDSITSEGSGYEALTILHLTGDLSSTTLRIELDVLTEIYDAQTTMLYIHNQEDKELYRMNTARTSIQHRITQ